MKYDLVLWDFDGTLANTGQDVWGSLEYAARVLGGEIRKQFRADDSNLGKSMEEIFLAIEPALDDGLQEKFEELVKVHYRTLHEFPQTVLYPGMEKLLDDLKAEGVMSFIITLKPQEALERILTNKGWARYFSGWLSPDSFVNADRVYQLSEADPEGNLPRVGRICTKSQLIAYFLKDTGAGKRIIYVGDTYSDVEACEDNGLDCIGVTYGDGDTQALLAAKPAAVVADVDMIGKLLKEGI